jgi:ferric-dicitrate binding protein FerR (iron transport regulator)
VRNSPSNCNLRRMIALAVAAGVFNLSAVGVFASSRGSAASLGLLRVSGVVTVNELPALSGLTIFSGSHIITSRGASSVLELGKQTRLVLSEQTELALDFSEEAISGLLERGVVHAYMPANRRLTLTTPAGVVTTDFSQKAAVNITVENGDTHISVEQGRVELRSGKHTRSVVAGETFSTVGERSMLPPQQILSSNERLGVVAGIGAGMAVLLILLTGGHEEEEFGGCVIVLSPIEGGGQCH